MCTGVRNQPDNDTVVTMSTLQEVNICDNRLTRFRLASGLPQLTHLILSGNELSIAEDFGNLVCFNY